MKNPTVPKDDFFGGFLQWLDTEEGQISIEATDDVAAALQAADLDIQQRRIIWSDGKRLTIDQTAKRIHKYTGTDLEAIKSHVIGWLEMGFEPKGLDETKMEHFETQIDEWIEDYTAGKLES
jgi:hypothetical protein